jgi:DNA-binding NarL/FixJ family response regulator
LFLTPINTVCRMVDCADTSDALLGPAAVVTASPEARPVRVLLIDDHPIVREGIAAILSDTTEFEIVDEVGSGEEGLESVVLAGAPDVVIVDVRLPAMNGLAVCAALSRRAPTVRTIVFTSYPTDDTIAEALDAGARGFVAKESGTTALRHAVRAVAAGETFLDPRLANRVTAITAMGRRSRGPFGLSRQELRVVRLLPRGLTNSQIGQQLGLSEQTVKSHLHNAMRKLRVANRAQAAALAQREGLA